MSRLKPHASAVLGSAAILGLAFLLLLIWATAAQGAFRLDYVPGADTGDGISMERIQAFPVGSRTASVRVTIPPAPAKAVPAPSGACYAVPGGPPASVIQRESGFDPKARNRSGAAGCYQFMPGTWGGYKGYASADQAPVEVQNEKAKQVWQSHNGPCHWRATTDQC